MTQGQNPDPKRVLLTLRGMDMCLGIDIGTSSVKVLALDAADLRSGRPGSPVAEGKKTYQAFTDESGMHEEDPEEIFQALLDVLGDLAPRLPSGGRIAALSFSAAMHGLLALDAQGRALTRLITWADTRAGEAARTLNGTDTARVLFRAGGTPIQSMTPLCKLIWLRKARPDVFRHAARFVSIKEYVWYRLFGVFEIDYSIASATALFDTQNVRWLTLALQTAGIREDQLSKPVPVTFCRTGAALAGVRADTPWVIGASDGCLANLGSGAVFPGKASLTIGTSGAVRVGNTRWNPDPEGRLFSYYLKEGTYITGGATNNGGNVLEWCQKLLGVATPDEAFSAPPGADGLLFMPYLFGERAPIWDSAARGGFIGLRAFHGRAHLVRAVMEGITFALTGILYLLEAQTGPIHTVSASGGFAQSEAWLQMLADITGKQVEVGADADASATGAAILAREALGGGDPAAEGTGHGEGQRLFHPDAGRHSFYARHQAAFAGLYPILHPTFRLLDEPL